MGGGELFARPKSFGTIEQVTDIDAVAAATALNEAGQLAMENAQKASENAAKLAKAAASKAADLGSSGSAADMAQSHLEAVKLRAMETKQALEAAKRAQDAVIHGAFNRGP